MRNERIISFLASCSLSFAICFISTRASAQTTWQYSVDTPEGEGLVSTHAKGALAPEIRVCRDTYTAGVSQDITLLVNAGQRSPMVDFYIRIPAGIQMTLDNTTVNVIGRGDVVLRQLEQQYAGKRGTHYSYSKVGSVELKEEGKKGHLLHLSGLDLRPFNGTDIALTIRGIVLNPGKYVIEASYQTAEPQKAMSAVTKTTVRAVNRIADLTRQPDRRLTLTEKKDYSAALLTWTPLPDNPKMELQASKDGGKTWSFFADPSKEEYNNLMYAQKLDSGCVYTFRFYVKEGRYKGYSNEVRYESGMRNALNAGLKGDGVTDDTDLLNAMIDDISSMGGGTIFFPQGRYMVRTVHLKSNVWLYLDKGAEILALPGADAPELTWFSDRAYRAGLSPTDSRPYQDPENYLTKQDVGHTFFHNAMFFGERIENVKIVGSGRISGNGHIVTSDKVMNNPADRRCDKMFVFKLCKDVEIGGIGNGEDLWYDESRDEPYYLSSSTAGMLHIDQGGHFVLLATGTDDIYVHDTWFGKNSTKNVRDIYDFMGCNDVTVRNIYSHLGSDDIVKLGSDCSLGFTRKASGYHVRNIIGDTNCNLFQIGSETADDITDVYVDNIYVLGANKAGFSISTNDGATVRNVHLNSGKTGSLHHRSVMKRTRAPFFISISNRGRVLGADAQMYTFMENGKTRKELLITNSNIGRVENITLNGVDISEVYAGSSFRKERWRAYDGSQPEATPIIVGYALPTKEQMVDGEPPVMPDGRQTGYIENIRFADICLTVKGGHPEEDAHAVPPEIGVGRYNVSDLKTQPAYGYWFRHVKNLEMENCIIRTERPDGRQPIVLDDVHGAKIERTGTDIYQVRHYGASGKGDKLDSPAIQKAIDDCAAHGGGTVIVPAGTYLSATIQLKDNVTLHLEKDALILGTTDYHAYSVIDPFTEGLGNRVGAALLVASHARNVAVTGEGTIDGQGKALKERHIAEDPRPEGQRWGVRPFLLRMVQCQGVKVEGITLKYAGAWTSHYFQCTDVDIHHVTIRSYGVAHNDGIDIDGCQHVRISDCDIVSGDDALCFKTTSSKMACRDIRVTNMRLKSNQAGIKMGTESMAPFEDIHILNCHIYDTKNGGIKLFSVDGAILHDVEISDITMDEVRTPMLFRLGARQSVFRKDEDKKQPVGQFRDVTIRNVKAVAADKAQLDPPSGILITGIPRHYITNLTLENIHIRLLGTGTEVDAKVVVPEAVDKYPEVKTFGPKIPAYGVWARHVRGLKLKNVSFELKNPDARPRIICEDGDYVENQE